MQANVLLPNLKSKSKLKICYHQPRFLVTYNIFGFRHIKVNYAVGSQEKMNILPQEEKGKEGEID